MAKFTQQDSRWPVIASTPRQSAFHISDVAHSPAACEIVRSEGIRLSFDAVDLQPQLPQP